jgi:hypothetical protein
MSLLRLPLLDAFLLPLVPHLLHEMVPTVIAGGGERIVSVERDEVPPRLK